MRRIASDPARRATVAPRADCSLTAGQLSLMQAEEMTMTPNVKAILANYETDNPGVKANLAGC